MHGVPNFRELFLPYVLHRVGTSDLWMPHNREYYPLGKQDYVSPEDYVGAGGMLIRLSVAQEQELRRRLHPLAKKSSRHREDSIWLYHDLCAPESKEGAKHYLDAVEYLSEVAWATGGDASAEGRSTTSDTDASWPSDLTTLFFITIDVEGVFQLLGQAVAPLRAQCIEKGDSLEDLADQLATFPDWVLGVRGFITAVGALFRMGADGVSVKNAIYCAVMGIRAGVNVVPGVSKELTGLYKALGQWEQKEGCEAAETAQEVRRLLDQWRDIALEQAFDEVREWLRPLAIVHEFLTVPDEEWAQKTPKERAGIERELSRMLGGLRELGMLSEDAQRKLEAPDAQKALDARGAKYGARH